MNIGIEEHWILPEMDEALRALPEHRRDPSLALNEHGGAGERLRDLGVDRLAEMDAGGIDLQVLSLAPPGPGPLDAAEARALARAANERAAQAVAAHPDRFRFLAALPMSDPTAAAEELRRAADAGAVGAMVYGRTGDVPLDDPAYDGLLSMAEQGGLPLFVHPQIAPPTVRSASYSGFDPGVDLALASFAWGWHVEAGTAVLRLIARGVFDRHPGLQVILGHWGELVLLWHERLRGLAGMASLQRSIDEVIRENLHATSSGMLDPALLRHVLAITSIDRLLLSTDYPFQRPDAAQLEAFLAELPSESDRLAFRSGNAQRLFGIPS